MAKKGRKKTSKIDKVTEALKVAKQVMDSMGELLDRYKELPPGAPPGPVPPPATSKLTPYDIIGVPRTVTEKALKKRYRELAHFYHSDLGSGSDQMMKEINRAYEQIKEEHGWK